MRALVVVFDGREVGDNPMAGGPRRALAPSGAERRDRRAGAEATAAGADTMSALLMNIVLIFALVPLLAVAAAISAAPGALAQDDEGRRSSRREQRLGIPGAQAPGPGAQSSQAPAVPAPVPPPPPAQTAVPPPDATATPAAPGVVAPPRPLVPSAPADPARSDAPSGWPKVVVAGGVYSPNRAHRVVIINGAPAREGAEPVPGVIVEQVRADRVVLSYRGQRHTVVY